MGIFQAVLRGPERRGDPTTLLNPAQWFIDWLTGGGGLTKAGVSVSEQTALSISAVWGCVRAIAEDVAKVPLEVLEELAPDESTPVPGHPLHRLLNIEPNDEMDAFLFREALTAHCLGWGNAYAEIERTNGGRPVALWPMEPSCTFPRRVYDSADGYGRIVYDYNGQDRRARGIPAEDVLHVRGLGFDGRVGYSVIRVARESLGMTLAAERFGAAFFGNGARPSGALKHPGKLSEQAAKNLRASWAEMNAGVDNAGKPAILEEGMEWASFTIPPEDAQFLQTRAHQVLEVCRWFRFPPHKLADLSRATFSNIEHQSLNYADDTLGGWFRRWEAEGRRKLFAPAESRLKLEHNEAELKRGDLKSRYDAYAVGRQWGWLTANDVLRMEGRNPLPENIGGFTLAPINMTKPELLEGFAKLGVAGKLAESKDQQRARSAAVGAAVTRAFTPAIEQALRSSLRVEADRARRAQARGDLRSWSAKFYEEHREEVRGRLFPAVESLAGAIRAACDGELDVAATVEDLARAHCEQSRREIESLSGDQAEAQLAGWEGRRAEVDAAAAVRRLGSRVEMAITGAAS